MYHPPDECVHCVDHSSQTGRVQWTGNVISRSSSSDDEQGFFSLFSGKLQSALWYQELPYFTRGESSEQREKVSCPRESATEPRPPLLLSVKFKSSTT